MNFSRLQFLLPILYFLLSTSLLYAQKTVTLHGTVSDAETGEPLSFVTVALNSRSAGAWTDSLGQFSFRATPVSGDSLQVTYVGYTTQSFALNDKIDQVFQVKLIAVSGLLGEVVITADPNPGKTLMKKVLARNKDNNPARFDRIEARRWSRSEVDTFDPKLAADTTGKVAADSKGLFSSRVRAFEKNRVATDTLRGETPLFFSEKLSDYTLANHPFGENEQVIAVKTTNLQTDKTLESLARWDAGSINLYEQRVMLFGKAFVSPTSGEALGFYDFYIVDSTAQPNGFHWIRLQAIPKTWRGNVFTGIFTIEDSTYAIVAADLRLSKTANLNFIDALALHQDFVPAKDFDSGRWVLAPHESTLSIRYEAGLELLGIPLPARAESKRIVARMAAVFDNVRLNDLSGSAAHTGGLIQAGRNFDSDSTDAFWTKNRPDSLSGHEAAIYRMADDLRNDPRQRAKDKLFATLSDGAYTVDNDLRFGPIGSLVSTNRIEGTRLRIGFRTLEGFLPKTSLFGHLAYGTLDRQWKGSVGLRFLPSTQPYIKTEFVVSSDYETLTEWYDELDRDNIANSLLRKNVPYYRTHIAKIALTQDHQIGGNFFIRGGLAYKKIDPAFDFSFANPDFQNPAVTPNEPTTETSMEVAEAAIGIRFAWHEASKIVNYQREPVQSKYPTVALTYTRGFRAGFADFNYQKLDFSVTHKTRLTPKAMLIWNLEAGKLLGTLPTLLLQVPTGNDAFVMSRNVFNTMTPYEFSADRYVSLRSRLALGGMLFDKIPFLQKLGWRERLTFNAFWGDLRTENRTFNAAQNPLAPNGQPFMEAGAGIENIFHLFSIDVMRRLNYLDAPGAIGNRVGIYLGLKTFF
jgi:hypothetical protein